MPSLKELNSIVNKYLDHVGQYDKAGWEHTVEKRIINGINCIPTTSAKIKSDLIDIDLVQGSSFPKAKPKHGLFTVTRQAFGRVLFLPLYRKWWTSETSPRLFLLLLFLYLCQVINLSLYMNWLWPVQVTENAGGKNLEDCNNCENHSSRTPYAYKRDDDQSCPARARAEDAFAVQRTEILTPLLLMLVLTILHSHIVSTKSHTKKKPIRSCPSSSIPAGSKTRNDPRPLVRRRSSSSTSGRLTKHLVSYSVTKHREHIGNKRKQNFRKVIFQEVAEKISSSNSDADECCHEKPLDKNEVSGGNVSKLAFASLEKRIDNNIMQKNMVEKEAGNSQLNNLANNGSELVNNQGILKTYLSKLSETSTTSASAGDNISSSDEENDVHDEDKMNVKSDWTAVTTCSDDYDMEDIDDETTRGKDEYEQHELYMYDHPFAWEFQKTNSRLSPSCTSAEKVSCTIWQEEEAKKAQMSVLDISSMIIGKVECAEPNSDYLYIGIIFSAIIGFLPCVWRLTTSLDVDFENYNWNWSHINLYLAESMNVALGSKLRVRLIVLISIVERLILALFAFFLLAAAEKTFKQRLLCAKLFSRLTSSRKAKKSGLPHFRLNKVRNIKTWLSVRSYLQKRGPQRSVDAAVSSTFIATLMLIFFFSVELLKDTNRMYCLYNIEVIAWSLCLGIFQLRFMTLCSRISQKYKNLSIIITEQLNLYLKMEQKPKKKDELLVANNVLKLAADLLKELDDPFKISSFASNPYLYNITRLVILSALSAVVSEMFGFKLKLYNIKLK